jgi:gliding motility-associated-like protein
MAGRYTNNKIVGFCDSILLVITITDFVPTTTQRNLSICIGDSIKIGRKFQKAAGTYLDTLKTWNMGCDSILRSNTLSLDAINIVANFTEIKCGQLPRGNIELLPTGGTAPYSFVWTSPLLPQQNQTCIERGTYTVTITDRNGCSATEFIEIFYNELEGCLQNNEGITPDGDGKNDNWVVPCLVGVSNDVVLYNRWGQIVYTKIDYTSEFNGIVNGTILPDGVYYYVIEVRGDLSTSIIKSVNKYRGTLTLIRH